MIYKLIGYTHSQERTSKKSGNKYEALTLYLGEQLDVKYGKGFRCYNVLLFKNSMERFGITEEDLNKALVSQKGVSLEYDFRGNIKVLYLT